MSRLWNLILFRFFFFCRKNSPGEVVITSESGERRVLRSTPDWSEAAANADHLWVATSASGDLCYVGESECTVIDCRKSIKNISRPHHHGILTLPNLT